MDMQLHGLHKSRRMSQRFYKSAVWMNYENLTIKMCNNPVTVFAIIRVTTLGEIATVLTHDDFKTVIIYNNFLEQIFKFSPRFAGFYYIHYVLNGYEVKFRSVCVNLFFVCMLACLYVFVS